jgi:putative membrane protein
MVRLFVYFAETEKLPGHEKGVLQKQYQLMQRRLWYGIAWPSAVITFLFGMTLIYEYGNVPPWLWIKLGFVMLLYAYHFSCHLIFKQQQADVLKYSSNQLRFYNEVSTVFLFAIVFLVVMKDSLSWLYGLLILTGLVLALFAGIKLYKKVREG